MQMPRLQKSKMKLKELRKRLRDRDSGNRKATLLMKPTFMKKSNHYREILPSVE